LKVKRAFRIPETEPEDRNFLKVVAKTFRAIEVIAQHPAGIQLSELCRQCAGQPKATIFRILHTLKELGYVQQDAKSSAYRLTREVAWLGRSESRETLKRAVRPHLERLRGQFEQTVALAVLDRDQLLYIEILDGLRSIRLNATVNTYAPLHCTSLGKAILSRLSTEDRARIINRRPLAKLTPNTITSIAHLERHLAEVRSQGYAVDDEETEEGARCVGAAICGDHGTPVAAISVSGPLSSLPLERIPEIAREVMRACRSISELMGVQDTAAEASGGRRAAEKTTSTTRPAQRRVAQNNTRIDRS
jgi:DNA-binding IclR family transcriptional regulator